MTSLIPAAREAFARAFPDRTDEPAIALAPGRVNLIGEHTDYNDGFVLPMAIDRHVAVAFAPAAPGRIRAHADTFGETRTIDLPVPQPVGGGHWSDYVAGVAAMYERDGHQMPGTDLALVSNLPVSAGLSSSAAVELATARALAAVADLAWNPTTAAALCRRAENEFVGVPCGIMDQLVIAAAHEGSALLIDCRSLGMRAVPMPEAVCAVVLETGVERRLAVSGYADRRRACETAVQVLRQHDPAVRALRDVDGRLLELVRDELDPVTLRRTQHVVAESPRAVDFAAALEAGELDRCRRLLDDSHWSLRDLYEVSCPELDVITALARSHEACLGARLTGAGFGGSALALVPAEGVEEFTADVGPAYAAATGRQPALHVCRAVPGVALV
jgi:galactokinase